MDSNCESLGKKMIGKPYSGKLNVRFDEGELEIEP
jgi:predicted HicB family RNase H-like nuclease